MIQIFVLSKKGIGLQLLSIRVSPDFDAHNSDVPDNFSDE